MKNQKSNYALIDYFAYGLFWSWNVIFLAFMVLGFAPQVVPELLVEVRAGLIPINFLVYASVLSVIPLIAVLLGATVLRKKPRKLFALGYVVEGPLMLLLAMRFFLIRQAPASLTLLLAVASIGMGTFLWYLLDTQIERRGRLFGYLRLIGLTMMLITSLYAALWIAFYAIPITGAVIDWFVRTIANAREFITSFRYDLQSILSEGWALIPLIVLGFILLVYTATLFVLAPIVIPVLSWRSWWQDLRIQKTLHGWAIPASASILTVVCVALLAIFANRQPQQKAFALLETPPSSPEEVQKLIDQSDTIRSGLLNAYLSSFRYMSAQGEVRHIRVMYEDTFDMPPEKAYRIQRAYERVASPLLYDPIQKQLPSSLRDNLAFQREPQAAAKLYQEFFDAPIIEGEKEEVVRAVRATWSGNQAEAAWQAVDDREVHLVQQEINIEEHGDWAEVELYEVYQNQTTDLEEVIYYFNLPESAVLTGVWLGNSPDRNERFNPIVAPRGAAQAVYRNETRQNRDPALLEQIGPRQYRLRAYPVPRMLLTRAEDQSQRLIEQAEPLHLWLTYTTFAQEDSWPLPQISDQRNVYWDSGTERLINGEPAVVEEDAWLPASVPASQEIVMTTHRYDFPNGMSVTAEPVSYTNLPTNDPDKQFAVVVDRSFSMAEHADAVTETLAELATLTSPNHEIDVYLTASSFRGEDPTRTTLDELAPEGIVYFGGQNAAELLSQFENLRAGDTYDAVLVLTDGSGYELGSSDVELPVPESPIWIVHVESDIPLGYDDETLQAIQASGGGVVPDLDQALARVYLPSGSGNQYSDIIDGYLWVVLPTEEADLEAGVSPEGINEPGFEAMAARQYINAEIQSQRGVIDELATLDEFHAFAEAYNIVTPYSSMIVLVNLQQENLLDQMEEGTDRFKREFEELNNTTPATQVPLTGVPEPEEWLLLSLAAAFLVWYAYRKRLAPQTR